MEPTPVVREEVKPTGQILLSITRRQAGDLYAAIGQPIYDAQGKEIPVAASVLELKSALFRTLHG